MKSRAAAWRNEIASGSVAEAWRQRGGMEWNEIASGSVAEAWRQRGGSVAEYLRK